MFSIVASCCTGKNFNMYLFSSLTVLAAANYFPSYHRRWCCSFLAAALPEPVLPKRPGLCFILRRSILCCKSVSMDLLISRAPLFAVYIGDFLFTLIPNFWWSWRRESSLLMYIYVLHFGVGWVLLIEVLTWFCCVEIHRPQLAIHLWMKSTCKKLQDMSCLQVYM